MLDLCAFVPLCLCVYTILRVAGFLAFASRWVQSEFLDAMISRVEIRMSERGAVSSRMRIEN